VYEEGLENQGLDFDLPPINYLDNTSLKTIGDLRYLFFNHDSGSRWEFQMIFNFFFLGFVVFFYWLYKVK
jgi:hypothetical protein